MNNHSDGKQELLLGELTAALAADAKSARDALPESVAERAVLVGEAMVRAQRDALPTRAQVSTAQRDTRARMIMSWSGWVAAAAMLALFAGRSRDSDIDPARTLVSSATMLRDSLLQADSALLRVAFAPTDDGTAVGASGDVVWSERAQRGVMRIVGLAANDRERWQYQLWIFDRNRDERYPVDGGVFDIPVGATEVLVPIDARLPVGDATLFAVTVEPAGGVVVSTRERIALTAGL